jgi:hypothetical protein
MLAEMDYYAEAYGFTRSSFPAPAASWVMKHTKDA